MTNPHLVRLRSELGLTQQALSKVSGISLSMVTDLEGLRRSPLSQGDWTPSARKLSDFHGLSPDQLWPAEVLEHIGLSLPLVRWDASDEPEESGDRWDHPNPDLRPDLLLLQKEFLQILDERLRSLPDHEREVMELIFGLGSCDRGWSLSEIGDYFDLTPTRIRQYRDKAFRRLREPSGPKPSDLPGLWDLFHNPSEVDIQRREELAGVTREKRRIQRQRKKDKQERILNSTGRAKLRIQFGVPTFGMYENFVSLKDVDEELKSQSSRSP
jgi:transcriptional regulator with XRE-family HTH domain